MTDTQYKPRNLVATKPTKAMIRFLRQHINEFCYARRGQYEDGFRPDYLSDFGGQTYDFVGRVRDLGLIEIVDKDDSRLRWPYSWKGTRITETGREAIAAWKGKL